MVGVLWKPLRTRIQFQKLWWTVRAMLIAPSPTKRQNKGWQSKSSFVTLISPVIARLSQMGWGVTALTALCGAAINTLRVRDEIWCHRNVWKIAAASFCSTPTCLDVFSRYILHPGLSWCMNAAKQTVKGSFTTCNAVQQFKYARKHEELKPLRRIQLLSSPQMKPCGIQHPVCTCCTQGGHVPFLYYLKQLSGWIIDQNKTGAAAGFVVSQDHWI